MLTYEEFKEAIRERAEEVTGNRAVISKTYKNNGVVLDGLTIMSTESNVSPTIYLNRYYNIYKEHMEEKDCVNTLFEEIYREYERHSPKRDMDMEFYKHYEEVRKRLKAKVVNHKDNLDWLTEIPHFNVLDLSFIFYVEVCFNEEYGNGTITVRNEHMEIWGKELEEVYQDAMDNMFDDNEVIFLPSLLVDELGFDKKLYSFLPKMYILTNRERYFGAISFLQKDVLKNFAEERNMKEVIIIPSSVHEVILVEKDDEVDLEMFKGMIEEVNLHNLDQEDVLSDHAYLYNRETDKIVSV